MSSSSWLITGANRGIGYGLVSLLIQRANTTVVAAVRDPKEAAKVFDDLAPKAAAGSKIVIVKISSDSETDAKVAVEELKKQDVNKLDVVIANAGISNYYGPIISTPVHQLRDHLAINSIGPIILFQAVWPLLEQSNAPKFIYITSGVGSIKSGAGSLMPVGAYGASKAAGNYITVKIHQEHPSLTAFAIHPGLVSTTEMGQTGVQILSKTLPDIVNLTITTDQSTEGILSMVDGATREKSGGKFKDYLNNEWPW